MAEVRERLRAARGNLDPLLAALDEVVRFVAIMSGLANENMTRGTGWLFLDLGRRIERAQYVLGSALGSFQQSPIDWDAAMRLALELCDSTITYRTRYLGQLQPAPVLDLVVLDDSNPRSLAFQLRAMERDLDYLARASGVRVAALPETTAARRSGDCKDKALWLASQLGDSDVRFVIGKTAAGDGEYKVMLHVIGLSFAAEMGVKGLYEKTFGRLTALIRGGTRTPEVVVDRLHALFLDFEEGTIKSIKCNGVMLTGTPKGPGDHGHYDGHHIHFHANELHTGQNRIVAPV